MHNTCLWIPVIIEKIEFEYVFLSKNDPLEIKRDHSTQAFWDLNIRMEAKSGYLRKMKGRVTFQAKFDGNKEHIKLNSYVMHMQNEKDYRYVSV